MTLGPDLKFLSVQPDPRKVKVICNLPIPFISLQARSLWVHLDSKTYATTIKV